MPRHLRQRSWPSWAPGNDHTQKRTGDKTSLKRRDHPWYSFREIALSEKCSFSAEARRGAGHHTLLVWLSAGRWSPARRDHRCAVTPALVRQTLSVEGESSSFNHYRSAPKRKDELMRCTCCLLYSRGDQRQLDAMIACQCPLARLVTLEVDRSLWRDPNFVGHPTWLGVTDWKGTWNILCSYCLQWNTSQSKFRNHYFLFLFAFSILSQLFLIWGCRTYSYKCFICNLFLQHIIVC